MIINSFTYLFLGALVVSIGALPVGLVNLSVVDASIKLNVRKSMRIAYGAALVEILFALIAMLAGTILYDFFSGNIWVKRIVVAVLMFSGIIFLLKRSSVEDKEFTHISLAFLKGAFLNLVSIQVFLFWLIAVSFLSVKDLFPTTTFQTFLFVIGVWLGKLAVLRAYAVLGKKVAAHSRILSQNINRFIGLILMVAAFVQLVQI